MRCPAPGARSDSHNNRLPDIRCLRLKRVAGCSPWWASRICDCISEIESGPVAFATTFPKLRRDPCERIPRQAERDVARFGFRTVNTLLGRWRGGFSRFALDAGSEVEQHEFQSELLWGEVLADAADGEWRGFVGIVGRHASGAHV